ncbi:molybdopterin oxidoreductase family protein [Sorangium sp. So ce726]|uniref:molybdopterin oxidoreductase family protein n=1 Tax=Sorangium sp. So ce726 TaxID=3133319 RepID=UPI003F6231D5
MRAKRAGNKLLIVKPKLQLVSAAETLATRTHCPYCAFQCGMTMNERGAHGVEVRADPDFPVNRGQMCIKGFNSAALLSHPGRVTTPLVRGRDGALHRTTWNEALSLVAERLRSIKARHGADANGAFGSGALTNEKAYLLGKFVRIALGSSQIDYNGRYCMASAAAGQNRAYGIDRGLPFPVSDIGETKTLMLWGSNCAETMPPIMQWVQQQRDQGGKLIVVDPRRTETARAAHLHLALTPGSDLALGNGLLALAIDMGFVDRDYIEQRTVGFDSVRRSLSSYEPAQVERMTGISLPTLREAVRWLATSESSMILSGRGPEQQSKGADTVVTFTNLMLALGKVGKPFSGYGCLTGQGNGQGGREHGQKADQLPGYRYIVDPAAREHVAKVWGVTPESLPTKGKSAYEMLDAIGTEGGLRGMLVLGSNVVVASPNASSIREKLDKLELLVVCDSFINETAEQAHVILPIKQWAEEEGTVTNLEGRVILRRRTMNAPPGLLSDTDILCELAERLGYGQHFRYPNSEAIFNELRRATAGGKADYSGITYRRLEEEQGVFWPCPSEEHPGTPRLFAQRFFFPDGRARFHVVHHRPAGEEPDTDYPLYFTTGRYKEHYNSGAQTRRVEKLTDAKPEPRLQMHPRLAQRLGAVDGGLVRVESRRGAVTFRVSVNAEIRPDTLFAPFHWGGRAAANILTNPALDPTSRMPEFKVCAVRAAVEK